MYTNASRASVARLAAIAAMTTLMALSTANAAGLDNQDEAEYSLLMTTNGEAEAEIAIEAKTTLDDVCGECTLIMENGSEIKVTPETTMVIIRGGELLAE